MCGPTFYNTTIYSSEHIEDTFRRTALMYASMCPLRSPQFEARTRFSFCPYEGYPWPRAICACASSVCSVINHENRFSRRDGAGVNDSRTLQPLPAHPLLHTHEQSRPRHLPRAFHCVHRQPQLPPALSLPATASDNAPADAVAQGNTHQCVMNAHMKSLHESRTKSPSRTL